MNVLELQQKMEEVNKRIESANMKRNQDIGRKEALSQQIESQLKEYNSTYGKELKLEDIGSTLKEVMEEKAKEVAQVEKVLACIESGDIVGANKLMGVEVKEEELVEVEVEVVEVSKPEVIEAAPLNGVSSPSVEQVPDQVLVQPQTKTVETGVLAGFTVQVEDQPVAPTPVAPTPVAPTPVAPTPAAVPTPVAPTPVAPTPVAVPTPVVPTPVAPTPVVPTPVAPTPVVPTPVAPTPVSSVQETQGQMTPSTDEESLLDFGDILNGTAFG